MPNFVAFFLAGGAFSTSVSKLFQSNRHHDLLSASIRTSKHPERLRAYFEFVTQTTIYGKSPKKHTSHADCITPQQVKIYINSKKISNLIEP
jgi:hypothetical protein